jgi:hypothetical protein
MFTQGQSGPRIVERAQPALLITSSVFASLLLPVIDIIDRAALLLKWPAIRP